MLQEAERVGFPLMIKAVMGGGGKGMRLVESPEGFDAALQACRREASAGFADDRMLLERCEPLPDGGRDRGLGRGRGLLMSCCR